MDDATGDSDDTEPSDVAEQPPAEPPRLVDPPGLARSRAVATLMDDAVRVPGTSVRVGIDPIVGVLPVAGDLLMALLSLYIVVEGLRLGVGARTAFRMVVNVALDVVVGSVPFVGDLFDAVWKANQRNVALIERHVEYRAA